MRRLLLVIPWLIGLALVTAAARPATAQVVVRGGVGVAVGTPGPYPGPQAYPYPPPRPGRYGTPYPGPYPGSGWGPYENGSWALQAGYEDGYREGVEDGRDGDRYDPIGQKQYRRAKRGYDRRYGPEDHYRQRYRDGFRQGYDRGYREGSYASRRYYRPWGQRPW